MIIKDLEISKELSRKELSGVRGGLNQSVIGGPSQTGGGINFFSSQSQTFNPTVVQSDVHPVTNVNLNTANVIASLGTLVGQL